MRFPIGQLPFEAFPEALREIPDAPERLFIRGEMPDKERILLCVVGSRSATAYGRRITHKLISGLAQYPVAIVSGLAHGIDTEAHKAAIDVGLPTIAVLPSSLDEASIYPANNVILARTILLKGGCLLSENEAPFKAMLHSFAERNRVMAGMSKATLIIEAGERSGTLITAKMALEYNSDVLAVPHELERPTGVGVNRLIREGALLVQNSADVARALGFKLDDTPTQQTIPTDLTDAETAVLRILTEPLIHDEILEKSGTSARNIHVALSSLLIRGLIIERLGKIERV
ncbi:DNA protecting protein DprA [Candidatus Adlerbacteria bacterium RIFOXYC1_FULL_48_26]|uniref:DNA protecting protein DprA n=1 Tax=Candidatus Adlerbacteria bacterium RIFOXYC1_FULL_48_26 TaxID=1797247 RepID=A0A1F4Y3I6_9BACT|nr:MAG: DNA protecting protein DprA [Candidatus Adlerbacteria bacterium RIFOXYC1_FULL_48_26]OGC93418.1 MAG: DNA protecting protein DprA [Candidatus Adlerbacteria bacterium RIFOXYB1_FULL_48_10]OGC96729.1 MAG: DNA protecting protein DprA [Candidatus Adlerbacteria bacterium RIFOXYD1_FULL_48_8]